jgi:PhnB protein
MAITAIHPYLNFNGNCEEAFAHYAKVLGATNTGIFRSGDAPPEADDASNSEPDGCGPLPADFADKVMNTELRLGDLVLMGSDCPPAMWKDGGQNYTVSIQTDDPAEAERLFAALMEGDSQIMMPMGETFWAKRFGMGTDSFGTPWMVNCMRDPDA